MEIIDRKQHQYDSTDAHGVERVKEPPLIRYTGPLATPNYHKIAQRFEMASPKAEHVQKLARKIRNGDFSDDIKVIALCWEALIDIQVKPKYNERLLKTAWDKATQVKCENGVLLQGRVMSHWAYLQCELGNYEEALDYIALAKQRFVNAAHSIDTASVIYTEIRIHLRRLSCAPLPKVFSQLYESTQRNYDLLLKHYEFMEEYEKYRVYLFFTEKAKLHLRSVLITDKLPSDEYCPGQDDLKKAKLCLNGASLHENKLSDQSNIYKGNHYLALSDLHLWNEKYSESIEYAEQAKKLFMCGPIHQEDEACKRLFEELSGEN